MTAIPNAMPDDVPVGRRGMPFGDDVPLRAVLPPESTNAPLGQSPASPYTAIIGEPMVLRPSPPPVVRVVPQPEPIESPVPARALPDAPEDVDSTWSVAAEPHRDLDPEPEAPEPVTEGPASVVVEPEPVADDPEPVTEGPALAVEPEPVADVPEPVVEEREPAAEPVAAAPMASDPEPVLVEPDPVEHEPEQTVQAAVREEPDATPSPDRGPDSYDGASVNDEPGVGSAARVEATRLLPERGTVRPSEGSATQSLSAAQAYTAPLDPSMWFIGPMEESVAPPFVRVRRQGPERVGRGLLLAFVPVVLGWVLSAALFHFGHIPSIVALTIGPAGVLLYGKGAGSRPRAGARRLVVMLVVGVLLTWPIALSTELYLYYVSQTGTHDGALQYVLNGVFSRSVFLAKLKEFLLVALFGLAGILAVLQTMLGRRRRVRASESVRD